MGGAGHEIIERHAAAPIGHVLHLGARLEHEQLGRQPIRRGAPGRAEVQLPRPCFHVGDQLGDRAHRQILVDHHHIGELRRHRDLDDVAPHVERKVVLHQRRNDLAAKAANQERVAIRRRAHDLAHADEAIAARLVLDDDGGAEPVLQKLRDQAAHDVGDAAGRERDHELDRPAGIALLRERRQCEERGRKACNNMAGEETTPREYHAVALVCWPGMILAVWRDLNSPYTNGLSRGIEVCRFSGATFAGSGLRSSG